MKEMRMDETRDDVLEVDGLDDIEIKNTGIDDLATENVFLAAINIDKSYSMDDHVQKMQRALQLFKEAIVNSKESDEILVSRSDFGSVITPGGYKNISEFRTDYHAAGSTVMYDMICQNTKEMLDYRNFLDQNGNNVRGIFAVFSDGMDCGSTQYTKSDAIKAIKEVRKQEFATIFICFGPGAATEARDLGFKHIIELDYNRPNSELEHILRDAFGCLSRSIIEASKSVVTGESMDDDMFKF